MSTIDQYFANFDAYSVPSPCFVVDEVAVEENLKHLRYVEDKSGAKVLAALKAFSLWHLAPLVSRYLSGTCASGLHEAMLSKDYYQGENHVYSAAYTENDFDQLSAFVDHIVFNSTSQWQRFQTEILNLQSERPELKAGLRVNPQHSEGATPLYDPCAPYSRLGIIQSELGETDLTGVSGLHFHTLCEQGFEPLASTIEAFERQFGYLLPTMEWVNFGGGHHITAPDYDEQALIELLRDFSARHDVQVYIEPGEAVALNTGVLVAEVVDITFNQMPIAILDTSATCHMPDTLEMPYRAEVIGAGEPTQYDHLYRLGGMTCLAGDVIGDYSFPEPLQIGQRLVFKDMAHYTMVKTTTFNGIKLPSIAIRNTLENSIRLIKEFTYEDFSSRLS